MGLPQKKYRPIKSELHVQFYSGKKENNRPKRNLDNELIKNVIRRILFTN